MNSAVFGAGFSGFFLGASLIIAIGAQNAFVLKLGILKKHVFIAAFLCSISDAVLIAAGVAGFGTLVQSSPLLITVITLFGAAFLFFYGALALKRAIAPAGLETKTVQAPALWPTITMLLTLTFVNPHVYLDTVVLLGGLSGQYAGVARLAYGIGAAIASFVWFFSLAYGARFLAPFFSKPVSWQVLDVLIAMVMWALAAKLIYSHFQF